MTHAKTARRPTAAERRVSERIAAVMALITLAAAVVLLLVGTVRNWAGILMALAGILVAVMAGWYVVSRRGAVRGVALAFAAGSVALLVWGFVLADVRPVRVVGTVVIAVASVAFARVALHRIKTERRTAVRAASEGARAAHPVLIMNPKSGGGKAERFHLVDECQARGIEPIVLRPGDDLVRLAEDAVARGADVIGMAGGDGSQALVAGVATAHDVRFVCVPAGTRNHLAMDLGLDRDDVVGALDAFGEAVERRIDLGMIGDRVFVNNATMGLYARIVQSPEYRDRKIGTALELLPRMLGRDAPPFDLRFTGPDGTEHESAHLMLVSNDRYELGRAEGFGSRRRIDAGTLGIVAARFYAYNEIAQLVQLQVAGSRRRPRGWMEWTDTSFEVRSGQPVEIGIDGEAMLLDPPIRFRIVPGALRVRTPLHAPGYSPAAAVPTSGWSTITALLQTAAGRPVTIEP